MFRRSDLKSKIKGNINKKMITGLAVTTFLLSGCLNDTNNTHSNLHKNHAAHQIEHHKSTNTESEYITYYSISYSCCSCYDN